MGEGKKQESWEGLTFLQSREYTLGVEIEFQTLDRTSCDLAPLAPILLANAPPLLRPRLSPEFIQSILEIQTGICHSVKDVENDLMQTVSMAEELAEDNHAMLFAASLHPFARHREQLLTTNSRYEAIMQELQIVGRRFITQGLHVHVGIPDGDTAVKVCNQIQAFLPVLLALSTSSPFSQGEDTGFMSYRTKLFEALPLAGIYTHVDSWKSFQEEVALLRSVGVIESIKDLWWDARPHPDFGTLEVRICDLPVRFTDILGITAMTQALVATLVEEKGSGGSLNQHIIKSNKWQAARHGLGGSYYDPSGWLAEERILLRDAVKILLERLEPMAARLGSSRYMENIQRILRDGTGSDFLRCCHGKEKSLKSVVQSLWGEFWL
jgi:carboxylate-amine ligase